MEPLVLENRYTGERLALRRVVRGEESWLEIRGSLPARSEGPPLHVHHAEDEEGEVRKGVLSAVVDGERIDVPAGGMVQLPRGKPHRWWNEGDGPLEFEVWAKPVVDLDRYLQAVFEVVNASPANRPSAIYMAHVMRRHRKTQLPLVMPRPIQTVVMSIAYVSRSDAWTLSRRRLAWMPESLHGCSDSVGGRHLTRSCCVVRSLARHLRPLVFALLVAACEGEPEPVIPPGDDAVIVENSVLPQESRVPWAIGTAPELSIGLGEAEDQHHLFRVRDAVVLEGGRIAIANGGTGEIRVFGPDGAHVVSMGGTGEGPGEFRRLESIAPWLGDSILGWDGRQQRISVFDSAGQHGRTLRVPQFNDSFGPEFLGVTPDGRFFLRAGFPQRNDEPFRGMFRPDQIYALLTGEGELAVDLGVHPGAEGFLSAGGGVESFYGHPHAKSTVAAVWGEQVLISPNDVFELRAFNLDGQLSMVARLDYETAPPTRGDMRHWFEDFTANDTPEERAAFRRTFDEFPLLESFPAFAAIVVDELGHVWVREFRTPGDERASWVVFDAKGVALGRIETPPGLEVYEIGADYVLGRARDEFDVEGVQRWPLTRQ